MQQTVRSTLHPFGLNRVRVLCLTAPTLQGSLTVITFGMYERLRKAVRSANIPQDAAARCRIISDTAIDMMCGDSRQFAISLQDATP